ncbi:MAG: hypothetical protein AAF926_06585, partial [Pseudomonadota bacterium]
IMATETKATKPKTDTKATKPKTETKATKPELVSCVVTKAGGGKIRRSEGITDRYAKGETFDIDPKQAKVLEDAGLVAVTA